MHGLRLFLVGRVLAQQSNGEEASELYRHPRLLGLLTYCAIEANDVQSVEHMCTLFWPESQPPRARQSLRQALYLLRNAAGVNIVERLGRELIRLRRGVVWCDAAELLTKSDPPSQLLMNGADLLPGLHIVGANEWECWLEHRRAAVRRRYVQCCVARSRAEAARGAVVSAFEWAVRALAADDIDSTATCNYLQAVCRLHGMPAAWQAFEQYRRRVHAIDAIPDNSVIAVAAALQRSNEGRSS